MAKRKRRTVFITCICLFICLFIILPLFLAFMAFENSPVITQVNMPAVRDAQNARKLAKRILNTARKRKEAVLTVSQEEINSLFAFAHRAIHRVTGIARIGPAGIEGGGSLYMPRNPFGDYLNIRFALNPSKEGLDVKHVYIGDIYIPGAVAVTLGKWAVDIVSGEQLGSIALDLVKEVSIDQPNVVSVHLKPLPHLNNAVDRLKKRFAFFRDSVSPLGDAETVRIFYEQIVKIDSNLPGERKQSLAKYMGPLFQTVRNRAGDPIKESQAAIIALSIFFGSKKVERLVGDVRTGYLASYKRRHVGTLANRYDLTRHFLISATLHIMADQKMSYAIGEFKELMDARWKGSGFSFADLAADRAGVRFAEMVTGSKRVAIDLMERMAQNEMESAFFPDVSQMPERLYQQTFEHHFKNVDSVEYKNLVNAIDQCISRLPVYSGTSENDLSACELVSVLDQELRKNQEREAFHSK